MAASSQKNSTDTLITPHKSILDNGTVPHLVSIHQIINGRQEKISDGRKAIYKHNTMPGLLLQLSPPIFQFCVLVFRE